jgi:hypothetical protein
MSLLQNENIPEGLLDHLCKIGLCETVQIVSHGLLLPMKLEDGRMSYLTEFVIIKE